MTCVIGGLAKGGANQDPATRRYMARLARTDFPYGTGMSRDSTTGELATNAMLSLNGLSGQTQTFVDDTNVSVVSSGTTHTITWLTTLAVARGGTGSSTAAGARTNLGLAIGTNVQAYDATLQSMSSLGTAADKYAYTTGVDTWAEGSITSFARTLLDDASAGDARTTLGVENSVWTNNSGTLHPDTHATEDVAIGGATTGAADHALFASGEAILNQNGSATTVGIGAAGTEGMLHVQSGSAGSATANGNLDEIVVESSGNGGITILTPDTGLARYGFGNPSDAFAAEVKWDYDGTSVSGAAGALTLEPAKAGADLVFGTDNQVERMRLSTNGLMIGGGSDAPNGLVHILKDGGSAAFSFESFRSSGNHNKFDAYAARGSKASPTILSSGDAVFEIRGLGHDGTDYRNSARIMFEIDGTPGASDMPGRITFQTSPDGSATLTNRLRIFNKGTYTFQSDSDVGQELITLDQNDTDEPFFKFEGTAAANTTNSISTLTTSGSVAKHVQVFDESGTKYWIALLNDPS